MTKYFNTNYHYLVPELSEDQRFDIAWEQLFEEVTEAQALGHTAKPVLLGPVTFLYLSKTVGSEFDRLTLLPALLECYQAILARFAAQGVEWVQLDEPALALELDDNWQQAFNQAYGVLKSAPLKLLLATYYGTVAHHQSLLSALPVVGIHLDLVTAPEQLQAFVGALAPEQVLSVGVINGRNVWAADLDLVAEQLAPLARDLGDRLWLATSCSLLHTPVDLEVETALAPELKACWLSPGKNLPSCRSSRRFWRRLRLKMPKPWSPVAGIGARPGRRGVINSSVPESMP